MRSLKTALLPAFLMAPTKSNHLHKDNSGISEVMALDYHSHLGEGAHESNGA